MYLVILESLWYPVKKYIKKCLNILWYKYKCRNCADVCGATFQGDRDEESKRRDRVRGQAQHARDLQRGEQISDL